ncbi:MAG TPA: glycosyltransferase family A protein [Cyanophyceae cyanobacterium]
MQKELTVIIPAYNGMPFLKDSIQSILNQTYKDFHLLIIDDGSTDGSPEYLKTLVDSRVDVRYQNHTGLCDSLNQAIASSDSELIARLDQDDIALPFRLQEEIDFLISHSDYACVLSLISRITQNGKEFGSYETDFVKKISDYKWGLYGSIVHSTICFRRESFLALGGYRSSLYPVDDYDLLLRFEEFYKVAVINRPLIKYRIHSNAGTFKTFYDMEFKTRYVEEMASRRRSGKPELSLMEFKKKELDQSTLMEKWKRYTHTRGKVMFRKAGLMIGEGQYISGLYNLMGACLLTPKLTFHKLLALYQNKRKLSIV